ncbi:MAG: prolyl-tRNA synthetase associated domain-containing protein [Rhodospirillum sp.]|nr:prolyl-tRNA synthetase associated domain-containing protein [Rhodospirillum sp.]MCF8490145.1 prolyl-tRNA synthetase associated domain-containing protein [Rhodospirillum sp.]MCF8502212.1 prolyl-tRNA synthetase associated domain-containing protein [Rhodospirillum sp.]
MPMATRADLLSRLEDLGISVVTEEHPPVFTVEEAQAACDHIPGVHCKNLFLKDAKGQLWLVVCPHDRTVEMKSLHKRIGSKRLSFGKSELLEEILGVKPGSVTPFALINDRGQRVKVVLDAWMMDQPVLNYHPLENGATTTISNGDLLRFIEGCGHAPQIVDLVTALEEDV